MTDKDGTRPKVEGLTIQCGGVVCEEKRLIEVNSGRIMVAVNRQDIEQIRLKAGIISPHPILQAGFGIVLSAVGYFPVAHFIHWFQYGGVFFEEESFLVPFAVIGLWLALSAFRSGRFLEVESKYGRKRFTFSRNVESAQIVEFVAVVEAAYGMRVERESFAI